MKQIIKIKSVLLLMLLISQVSFAACAASSEAAVTNSPNEIKPEAVVVENAVNQPNCSKTGPDSTRTLDEYSLFSEPYKQDNFKDALPHWRYVFFNAPGFHEYIHIAGLKMYQSMIEEAKDPVRKEKLIDTLMMVYDKRIQCFGNEGYNLGRKGYDLMKYRSDSVDQIRVTLDKAIKAGQEKSEYFILYPYAKLTGYAYQQQKLTDEQMFKIYDMLNMIIDKNKESQYAKQYEESRSQILDWFTEIGLLKCDNLTKIYADKYKANPADQEVWKQAYSVLKACNDCNKSFNEMYKKLFEIEPSADLAIKIAMCDSDLGNSSESIKYMDKAMELATDKEQKARLAYNAALTYYKQNNYSRAREYANKAINFRPGWGDPYILIGTLYASSGSLCGPGTGFESQVVVWPAIDMWQKAKSVDPSAASEADRLINKYSAFMPSTTQLFEQGIAEGSSYTVGCWINVSTTVRGIKK